MSAEGNLTGITRSHDEEIREKKISSISEESPQNFENGSPCVQEVEDVRDLCIHPSDEIGTNDDPNDYTNDDESVTDPEDLSQSFEKSVQFEDVVESPKLKEGTSYVPNDEIYAFGGDSPASKGTDSSEESDNNLADSSVDVENSRDGEVRAFEVDSPASKDTDSSVNSDNNDADLSVEAENFESLFVSSPTEVNSSESYEKHATGTPKGNVNYLNVYEEYDDLHPGIHAVSSNGSDLCTPLAREAGNFFDNDYDSDNDSISDEINQDVDMLKYRSVKMQNQKLKRTWVDITMEEMHRFEMKDTISHIKDLLSDMKDVISDQKEHMLNVLYELENKISSMEFSKFIPIFVLIVALMFGAAIRTSNRTPPSVENQVNKPVGMEDSYLNNDCAKPPQVLADAALDAAAAGDVDLLTYILMVDSNTVHSQDPNLWTPLHESARSGNLECAKRLVDHGADMFAKTVHGETPLEISFIVHGDGHEFGSFLAEEMVKKQWPHEQRQEYFSSYLDEMKSKIENIPKIGAQPKGNDEKISVTKDSKKRNKLFDPRKAVSLGDIHYVEKYLIENKNHVNKQDSNGWALLHEAARGGHVNVFMLLIENGADVHLKTQTGETSLQISLGFHGDDHPISVFCDALMKDILEKFLSAAAYNNLEELRAMISSSPNLLFEQDSNGWGAIHEAAKVGNNDAVSMLLVLGVDLTQRTISGESVLDIAVKVHGDAHPIVGMLKATMPSLHNVDATSSSSGEDKSIRSEKTPPVNLAGTKSSSSESTAPGNNKLDFSPVALDAAANGDDKLLSKLLEETPLLLDLQDDHGWSPLHEAAKMGHEHIVSLLFDFKADTELKIISGETAMDVAIISWGADHPVVALFLEHKRGNIDQNTGDILSDAFSCIRTDNISSLVQLLQKYPLLNDSHTQEGWSLLHEASSEGTLDIVKLLVTSGADVTSKTIDGENSLDVALGKFGEQHEVVLYLVEVLIKHLKKSEEMLLSQKSEEKIQSQKSPVENISDNMSASELVKLACFLASENDTDNLSKLIEMHPLIVYAGDLNGWGPLHEAARAGQLLSVIILLQHGANANAGSSGGSSLEIAQDFMEENHPVIEALLNAEEFQAKISVNNSSLKIVENFLRLTTEGNGVELAKSIEDYPLLLYVKDENGWGAIHEVARSGSVDRMRVLLRMGADINMGSSGGTPKEIVLKYYGSNHPLLNFLEQITAL
eukprot:CAMPEP_0194311620 /NCGR_PEP_ID=MMETSP0171-20130528/8538_1 /TAXON_ID=218684 /ORGANISM="Corethron pennatum, Strain L29A3" /LENGTH=1210 /DNA_ID=CAMNT_0039065755 /DNA_START=35 /DNA_END=3667 /DNA_ORIENTATION=+